MVFGGNYSNFRQTLQGSTSESSDGEADASVEAVVGIFPPDFWVGSMDLMDKDGSAILVIHEQLELDSSFMKCFNKNFAGDW